MLTDIELRDIVMSSRYSGVFETCRAIEQAVLSKFAGVSVEPAIKEAKFGGYDAYTAEQFFTAIAAARLSALEEAAKVANRRAEALEQHLVNNGPEMVESAHHFTQGAISASRRIEAAIRALIGAKT